VFAVEESARPTVSTRWKVATCLVTALIAKNTAERAFGGRGALVASSREHAGGQPSRNVAMANQTQSSQENLGDDHGVGGEWFCLRCEVQRGAKSR
jgi:hypothetical protein